MLLRGRGKDAGLSFGGWVRRSCFWTNDFLHGGRIGKWYREMPEILSNHEKGSVICHKRLSALLDHAVSCTEMYAAFRGEHELRKFPVVNKAVLTECYEKNCVASADIPGQKGQKVHIQNTSGSTGTPFRIPQDVRKRSRRVAELKWYNFEAGVRSHERIGHCRVWTKWQGKSKWQSFRENIIPINVTKLDDSALESLFRLIRKKNIVLIRAYANWIGAMARFIEEGKGDPADLKTLKVCLSTAEALDERARETMLRLAGVPVIEAYVSEEAGVMGQQRIGDNGFYLNHAGYVFEFLKPETDTPAEEGELSRIVITDLFNYAFPLIRYDTGDLAVFHTGNEKSGGWPFITELCGRKTDLIFDTDGVPVLPNNFGRILKHFPGIIQWQVVQTDEKAYELNLTAEDGTNTASVTESLKEILGEDADISVRLLDGIPVHASGKRKAVVCRWDRNGVQDY